MKSYKRMALISAITLVWLGCLSASAFGQGGTWTTLPSMPTARCIPAVGANGSTLYVAGGALGPNYLATLEAYDTVANTWSSLAPMPTARMAAQGIVVNGIFYVFGGQNSSGSLSTVEAYDPATNTWTERSQMPFAGTPGPLVAVGGLIYVIGGGDPVAGTLTGNVEAYDPNSNTWTTRAPMPTVRWSVAAGLINGQIYVIGGVNRGGFLTEAYRYDPVQNAWGVMPNNTGPAINGGAGDVLNANLFYVDGSTPQKEGVNTVTSYAPATDTYTNAPPAPTSRIYMGVVTINGRLYAVGGTTQGPYASYYAVATLECFTPAPVPFISQPLVPAATAPGGPGFTLTVNGAGFVSGSVVNWNGSALATTFVNSDQLTAAVPASQIAAAGTAWITVSNPVPGRTSNVAYFEVTNPTQSVSFTTTDYQAGSGPYSVAVGDFNGDGKPDLAVANSISNNVSVLLGNGDGTFQAAVNYAAGSWPISVTVGDFNGDGKLDLAVANYLDSDVSVLLGNGDGTFQTPVNYGVGWLPFVITAGDFNGDGKLDLAVGNLYSSSVGLMLGNGDGTFQAPRWENLGAQYPLSLAVADFNGDGKLDLVAAVSWSYEVVVLLGNGDGTFQAPVSYFSWVPRSVTVGDFNGDGRVDLAVAEHYGNDVIVLLGNGDGTFQPAVSYAVGTWLSSVSVGDINGDGKLDLTVAGGGNSVSVLLGNGDGTFQAPVKYTVGSNNLFSVAVADFNGDGRMDLAVTVPNIDVSEGSHISILLQVTSASADSTPPLITPTLEGTAGNDGWYKSDVAVSWGVTDPESGIASKTGCDPITLSSDTAGQTLTCSATNGAGLANSVSVAVKIDKTLPVITITAPQANYNLLQREQVAASYACSDALSGVKTLSGPVSNGANVDTSTLGDHNFIVSCTDNAGNTATLPRMYKVITLAGGIGQTVDIVNGMNLQQGIENSLDAKLSNTQQALQASNAGQRQDAVNKLNSVISATEAQRGKQLTSAQADQIIAQVRRIMALL